jgi:rhodanese-related sulfurtransferase
MMGSASLRRVRQEPTMRKRVAILVLPLLLAVGLSAAEVTDIDSTRLAKLLAEGVAIVDVRVAREQLATGVVKGSHLLSFYDRSGRYDMDGWVRKLHAIVGPEDPVILICGTGKLSVGIAEYLDKRAGHTKVYNVRDGIKRWIADGHPTVSPT